MIYGMPIFLVARRRVGTKERWCVTMYMKVQRIPGGSLSISRIEPVNGYIWAFQIPIRPLKG